jgi:hypothetical protein
MIFNNTIFAALQDGRQVSVHTIYPLWISSCIILPIRFIKCSTALAVLCRYQYMRGGVDFFGRRPQHQYREELGNGIAT